MADSIRLSSVAINRPNAAELAAFYADITGGRVTFAGEDLRYFLSDGRDQSLSLFLPHPGQSEPRVPVELGWGSPRSGEVEGGGGWWQAWRELPDTVRAVMRSYTLRELRTDAGSAGPAPTPSAQAEAPAPATDAPPAQ